jgi:hypothetical protein
MVDGFANFTAGEDAAAFQDQLDPAGDVPLAAAAERHCYRVSPPVLVQLVFLMKL